MFHHGEASAPRYHKALLLMEGLSLLLTEQDDIISVSKCESALPADLVLMDSGPDLSFLCVKVRAPPL